jgi:hypothetical protein
VENGVVKPATQEFMSFLMFHIAEQNIELLNKIKTWARVYYKNDCMTKLKIPYQSQFDDNKVEILI